jgi:hypothetical protein
MPPPRAPAAADRPAVLPAREPPATTIQPDHRERLAVAHVRQSNPQQGLNHQERAG